MYRYLGTATESTEQHVAPTKSSLVIIFSMFLIFVAGGITLAKLAIDDSTHHMWILPGSMMIIIGVSFALYGLVELFRRRH